MTEKLHTSQCIVVKIGSALLIDEAKRMVNIAWLESLLEDLLELIQKNIKIVLVSSGATAFGKLVLGMKHKAIALDKKQAASAVGQIQLIHLYQTLLNEKGIQAGQVLLTLNDTEHRSRYINLRNTLKQLIQMNVIPIINENDSVSTDEIRYGDNDRLAARVAQMVEADTLILLSDINGFYTDDPHLSSDAKLIPSIDSITTDLSNMAKNSHTNYGSGGMITKLSAARIAMNSGCRMLITNGRPQHPLRHFITTNEGTWFKTKVTAQRAKKIWLQEHLKSLGTITIDAGAEAALLKGASLLPVGIVQVGGDFVKGSVVTVYTRDRIKIARGLINYSQHEISKIKGKKTVEIEKLLGYYGPIEVIHRDNLVVLNKKDDSE